MYLTSPIFSNEDVALRSMALSFKANFKNKYKETDDGMLRVKILKSEKMT